MLHPPASKYFNDCFQSTHIVLRNHVCRFTLAIFLFCKYIILHWPYGVNFQIFQRRDYENLVKRFHKWANRWRHLNTAQLCINWSLCGVKWTTFALSLSFTLPGELCGLLIPELHHWHLLQAELIRPFHSPGSSILCTVDKYNFYANKAPFTREKR